MTDLNHEMWELIGAELVFHFKLNPPQVPEKAHLRLVKSQNHSLNSNAQPCPANARSFSVAERATRTGPKSKKAFLASV
jgi:hypothetical protein